MKSVSNRIRRSLAFALALILLLAAAPFAPGGRAAAKSAFETSIAAFPESYRVLLRELHKAHPKWEFTAMNTGLNWDDVINAESSGNRSLVPASNNYANIFKSKAVGDYNYNTGSYIQKDGGCVNGNKYAVSFFMDPRNFLNDENIFMFEDLSFDDSFDVNAIEVILSGTFMYRTKISYLTSSGEQKTTNETYGEAIYLAGKTYNVNPCYLASKIRGEIGAKPSGSVTGTNSTYPGIYNFYNIGASDGAGAITRGLAWAANTTAGTYGRPWDTPHKSILGGAQFIAGTYIAKGQQTSYLQRFNVNPKSSYQLYEHQYMTYVAGASTMAYSTYLSYLSSGLIDNRFSFSIPVYRGMTGQDDNTGTLSMQDATNQTGVLSITVNATVRSGPSPNYDSVGVQLVPGDAVKILAEKKTESHYYDSILRYPNWYKVRFAKNGTTYTGWVSAGFFTLTSSTSVGLGAYVPPTTTTNKQLKFKYVSMDPRIATVENDTKLKFISTGTVNVLGYDSTGRYAVVKYDVSSNASPQPTTQPTEPTTTRPPTTQPTEPPEDKSIAAPTGLSATGNSMDGFILKWNAVKGAAGYRVYLFDEKLGSFQPYATVNGTSYTFSGLKAGTICQIKLKAFKTLRSGATAWSDASALFRTVTTPQAPKSIKQTSSTSTTVSLKWSAVKGATLYQILRVDDNGAMTRLCSTDQRSVTLSKLQTDHAYNIAVRPILTLDGKNYVGAASVAVTVRTGPAKVTALKQDKTTSTSYRLSWSAVDGATGYKLFRLDPDTLKYVAVAATKATSYTFKDLTPGQFTVYIVRAYRKADGLVCYGDACPDFNAATAPAKVKGLQAEAESATALKLNWDAVTNAAGYCVYLKRANGSWKRVARTEDNRCTVDGLPTGKKATLCVRAYIRADGGTFWGVYSKAVTAIPENNEFILEP